MRFVVNVSPFSRAALRPNASPRRARYAAAACAAKPLFTANTTPGFRLCRRVGTLQTSTTWPGRAVRLERTSPFASNTPSVGNTLSICRC